MGPRAGDSIFGRYLRLTRDGVTRSGGIPAVVVWPETASPFWLGQDALARRYISEASKGGPGLIGALRYDRAGKPRNSLFALTDAGTVAAYYDKWHLVPFGEYQPSWFPAGIQIVPGGGLSPGPGPRTLHIPGLPPVGPLICYEAIFPGQAIDEADRPAWMVNITNDAWFGNFERSPSAPRCCADAGGGGGAAAAARRQHRDYCGIRCERARTGATRKGDGRGACGCPARRPAGDAVRPVRAGNSGSVRRWRSRRRVVGGPEDAG